MKVALVFNARGEDSTTAQDCRPSDDDTYVEWDVWPTIHAMRDALAAYHQVLLVEHDGSAAERLRNDRPDIVFNFAEGLRGAHREAEIPMICESLRIPYTGSDPLAMGLCLHKGRTKQILHHAGVPTPSFRVVPIGGRLDRPTDFPVLVKPVHEGSSKGIFDSSLVTTEEEFAAAVGRVHEHYQEPALVESFLPGREFTIGILGNGAERRCLPVVEIDFSAMPNGAHPIYSYEAKWVWDTSERPLDLYRCPAPVDERLAALLQGTALSAMDALDVRDWCRIDLRLDARDVPHVLELNPIPGLLPDPNDHSSFSMAAREAGMSYTDVVNEVVRAAAERTLVPTGIGNGSA